MSRVALIIAGIYFVIAAYVIVMEAVSPPSGGWITLRYMGSFLATFPVSAPLSKFDSNRISITGSSRGCCWRRARG